MRFEMKSAEGRRPIVKSKKYAPATGIQSDFEKVLTTFVETNSVRYQEFAKIWRERKLSLICAGRQTDRETVEFIEECLKIAFKMFLPPYGFQARVGALYLLYGLYTTQPCLPKVKIRMTKADWAHVQSLQEDLVQQNHLDTSFILQKMLASGAFYFCAASEEARSRYNQSEDANKSMADVLREDKQRIDDLFTDEMLEHLTQIHTEYNQMKVALAGPDASRPDRSLDVLLDKFPATVTEQLLKHHERWKEKESSRQAKRNKSLPTIPEQGESEEVTSDPDYQPTNSVGQRRAQLKAMAFRGAKNKQRYKHRALATESPNEKNTSPQKKRGKQRGDKAPGGIQRATIATVGGGGEIWEVPREDASGDLLHMPQFDDMEVEGRAPGRKRKAVAADLDSSSSTLPKQTKTGDSAGQVNAGNAGGSDVTAATTKPSKKRGRPPKPKPDTLATASRVGPPTKPDSPTKAKVGRPKKSSSPTKGKVGRPRKQTEADSQNNVDAAAEKPGEAQGEPSAEAETLGSSRGAKARVAPLKVRDSGKGKGKK